jgi:hypothetical protein
LQLIEDDLLMPEDDDFSTPVEEPRPLVIDKKPQPQLMKPLPQMASRHNFAA